MDGVDRAELLSDVAIIQPPQILRVGSGEGSAHTILKHRPWPAQYVQGAKLRAQGALVCIKMFVNTKYALKRTRPSLGALDMFD